MKEPEKGVFPSVIDLMVNVKYLRWKKATLEAKYIFVDIKRAPYIGTLS